MYAVCDYGNIQISYDFILVQLENEYPNRTNFLQ